MYYHKLWENWVEKCPNCKTKIKDNCPVCNGWGWVIIDKEKIKQHKQLNSSIGKSYKRKENNLSVSQNKAIKILESIAEYMGDENMFDCKNGDTRWYDLEDMVAGIIEAKN